MGYIAQARSRRQIREVAELIRRVQFAENELYFPILDFVEKTLPQIVPSFSFRVGTLEQMGECQGLTIPEKNEIWIRQDVYLKAGEGGGRERLTIAHELYHYLEHSKEPVAFARTSGEDIPAYRDPEWQADAFGGELLIPHHLIKGMSAEEVSVRCGVSYKAAQYQLRYV